MKSNIQVRYKWTQEELEKVALYHYKQNIFRWLRWVSLVVFIGLLCYTIFRYFYSNDYNVYVLGTLVGSLLFTLLFWLLDKRKRKKAIQQAQEAQHSDDAITTYHISDTAISKEIQGEPKVEQAITDYKKTLKTREGYILYQNRKEYLWLPNYGFTYPDEVKQTEKLLRKNIRKFKTTS